MLVLFFILYSILVLSFTYVLFKNRLKTLFYLPLFWMFEEMLSTYFYQFDSNGTINALTFIFILYALFKLKIFKIFSWNLLLTFFLVVAFIKTPFQVNYISFINRYINVFNIYMILPLSYYIIKDVSDFVRINRILKVTMIFTVIYLIVSSILKTGPNMYNTGLIYGLQWGQIYGPALIAVLLLLYNDGKQKNKYTYIFSALMIVLIFLTFRRTAILIISIFFFLYFLFTFNSKKIIYLLIFSSLVLVFYQNIENFSSLSNSSREIKYSEEYDITTESRYYDIFGVYEFMKKEGAIFTGKELFNEYGEYGAKRDSRPIHVDIMRFFYGVGFLGVIPLVLLLIILSSRILLFKKDKNIRGIGVSTISVFILTLFVGGSLYISFSGIAFIYLGGILRFIQQTKK